MSPELRDVRRHDLRAVHTLNESGVPHVSVATKETMEWFASTAAYFRVAVESDVVLAFLIGLTPEADYASMNFRWFRERYDSFVYIDRIVVSETARRSGLGLRLYRDIESFARARAPILACEVNTRPRNADSLAFHEKLGFERVGSQDTEGGAKTVAMFVKRLAARDRA